MARRLAVWPMREDCAMHTAESGVQKSTSSVCAARAQP
jgi:hypothetical protein